MSDPVDDHSGSETSALMMALVATLGLSLKGVFAKFAYLAGATVFGLVLIRLVVAMPLFWAAERVMRSDTQPPMMRRDALMAFAFGALFLIATLSDFSAIDRIGAGLSRIVLFTYPLIVVFISSAMERRWPSRRQLWAFVVAYSGLLIILRPGREEVSPDFWLGVGLSVLCAFSIAGFYALSNPLIKRIGPGRFSTLTQLSAMIGMGIIALFSMDANSFAFGWIAYLWIGVIILFATVVPILMQYEAMRRIGAARVSLIGLLGPVVTVAIAWLVLDERLDLGQVFGFVLVLTGIAILEWRAIQTALRRKA